MTNKTTQTQYLKLIDIVEEYSIPKSTAYYLIKTQNFPKQIKLSKRSAVWKRVEIDAWFAERAADGDKQNG